MLERKIMQKLIDWKNQKDKKSLIIEGARQVGKTYIISKFAEENYENIVTINFYEQSSYTSIFDGDLDINTIEEQILLRVPNANLVPQKTLIFLDEIQNCPRAIMALKFFTIANKYDVIASGSLLGIHYQEVPSFPVGYVEKLEMHSLDFEEFCWANGVKKESILDIKKYFDEKKMVPIAMHEKMLELFRNYIIVGGMPEIVENYVENHDFPKVLELQRNILDAYANDIAKYASSSDKSKIRECFFSIPKHLAKDYKKFRYGLVEKNGTSRKYEGSLQWLVDANIISMCYNLSTPELPLEGNARNDCFKVYMRDTGLLMAMLEDGSQEEIMNGNLGIYKGAIYENIIADIFTKLGKKLYYFEHNSTIEVDFFIRYEQKATAVEVKSSENTKSKSLKSVMTNYGVEQGIRLSSKNIGYKDNVLALPIYMAIFL